VCMAYDLQALIADEAVIATAVPTGAVLVPLPQGKAMIPFSEKMREVHDIPFLPLTDEGADAVPESITGIVQLIAKGGRVAYVEAEFFGGDGTQASVTWETGGQHSEPLIDVNAINVALRFLGVQVASQQDEFEALGLGRHRTTGYWELHS
jgi:hypothetical protein